MLGHLNEALDRLFTYMWNRRLVAIAAAGNVRADALQLSTAGLNSLTVGASDSDNTANDAGAVVEQGRGLQTNGGEEVDVFAPGVSVRHVSISNRNEGGGYDAVSADLCNLVLVRYHSSRYSGRWLPLYKETAVGEQNK